MKKFLGGSAIAAGVLLTGLMAGYWHFADLMPRRDAGTPLLADRSTAEPDDRSAAVAPEQESAAVEDASVPQGSEPIVINAEPTQDAATPAEESEEAVAAISPPAAEDASAPASAPAAAPDEPAETAVVDDAPTVAAANDPAAEDQGDGPSFELLRVEPDGSAVVAGRSAPGGEVMLRRGEDIIARDTVGPSGDFAMTLDAPLGVGDHALRLETIDPQGRTLTSPETAIVSVPPRGREEELLVVVEQPNAPSQILAAPSAPAADESESVVASASEVDASGALETQTAMLPPATDEASDATGDAIEAAAIVAIPPSADSPGEGDAASNLAIAAVEIEGERVYIAGTANRGATVRLYLDDALIAEAVGGTAEEFIAEATTNVPVGPHVVRADEIGADGSVVARVEVPFDRPEGTSMAALAPVAQTPADPVSPEQEAAPQDVASPASAPADTIVAETAPEAPQPSASGAPAPAEPAPRADERPEAATEPAPRIHAATPDVRDETARPVTPLSPAPAEDPMSETAIAVAPERAEPGAPASDESTSQAPVVTAARTQAALEPVVGRVIIRRGDTLWRISKNAYGLGSRYSVIYLANGDQIRDPDRIYPGQVFRMPGGRKAEGRSVLN